jgi:hypothetical protein
MKHVIPIVGVLSFYTMLISGLVTGISIIWDAAFLVQVSATTLLIGAMLFICCLIEDGVR